MVETFPSDRPDQSFRKTVLPRRAVSDGFVTDAHSSHAACNHRAVDTIPITDQIAWSLVPRECLADLASNPRGSGSCGDGNPDQAPAGQSNNDKAIEQIKANGRSNEQIHGRDVRRVVAQEGAPGLGGRSCAFFRRRAASSTISSNCCPTCQMG